MPRYASIYHITGYGSTSISSIYSITSNVTSMNEGDSVIFTITTTGLVSGTLLYWTTEGTVAANRFTTNTNSGFIIINNNTGTLTRSLINNLNIDGTTSFRIVLRTASITGPIVATSDYITVNDTSIPSEAIFDGPGTYSWTVPTGVTLISVVAVGGGGGPGSGYLTADNSGSGGGMGGGGGALAYTNNISVTPGQVVTVQVGAGGIKTITGRGVAAVDGTDGGDSFITYNGTVMVHAGGGQGGNGIGYVFNVNLTNKKGKGGTVIVGTGGAGGQGGVGAYDNVIRGASPPTMGGGGGGAGGYSGAGGAGGNSDSNPNTKSFAKSSGGAGSGGGGGGGRSGWVYLSTGAYGALTVAVTPGSGGGVGLFGQGSNGAGGYFTGPTPNNAAYTAGGGSGGSVGTLGLPFGYAGRGSPTAFTLIGPAGNGAYGGGGGGSVDASKYPAAKGGDGAVRIIWPTASYPSRAFPSTNAGQV